MKTVGLLFVYFSLNNINSYELVCHNVTSDASVRQNTQFKMRHPHPIGLLTSSAGIPTELRDINIINSRLSKNTYFYDLFGHFVRERIPQRHAVAKGVGVRGYFEVTNDVSKYTKADVFNGIGKKTPLLTRFSISSGERGGSDVKRALRALGVKLYTNEGNLDFLSIQIPFFFTKQPMDFKFAAHSIGDRNPKTYLYDFEMQWDLVTLRPWIYPVFLYLLSDYGIPNGYRKTDYFPLHTYELNNKEGDRYFARFNFRTEQGFDFLTTAQAAAIQSTDLFYFIRDMYNAVEEKNYPSWRLEMDVMSVHNIKQIDFDPFDVTQLWKNGTYRTVPIGRMVLNEMPENQIRDNEQAIYNPASLVPGIPGPVDVVFEARRFAYQNAHNYRLGSNNNNIEVNRPIYAKTYNRDGAPPVRDNMKDAPIYYPNSFNGPIPYVDESRPKEQIVYLQSNAVDLQSAADFYNNVLSDAAKQRLADSIVSTLQTVKSPLILKKVLKLLSLTDTDLFKRVITSYNLAGSCRV